MNRHNVVSQSLLDGVQILTNVDIACSCACAWPGISEDDDAASG